MLGPAAMALAQALQAAWNNILLSGYRLIRRILFLAAGCRLMWFDVELWLSPWSLLGFITRFMET